MSYFDGLLLRLKMAILYEGAYDINFEKFKPENYKNIDVKFTLRLPDELHQEIATYSTKHNISMNTLILNCIEYALSNREDF